MDRAGSTPAPGTQNKRLLDRAGGAVSVVKALQQLHRLAATLTGSKVSTIALVLGRGVGTAMHTYRDLIGIRLANWDEIHVRWWGILVDVFDSMPQTD